METWRRGILARLDVALVVFDLVLSVIFVALGYLSGSPYIRGVGVGLVIAGVTGGIAYLYKTRVAKL
jgi:type III secretory pathway component EscR